MGKYSGTFLLSVSHFEFCDAGIAKHDFPPHDAADLGRGEQERAAQSRAEPHLIALGLARSEVEMSLSCFLGFSGHRVLAPAEPEVPVDSAQTLRDRMTAETDRQRLADRSMVFSVALVTPCCVLSCPLVSKSLGCRPWTVSQLHSCPCPAFLAATTQ